MVGNPSGAIRNTGSPWRVRAGLQAGNAGNAGNNPALQANPLKIRAGGPYYYYYN